MGLINLLFKDPLAFVLVAIPLLYSIIIHELAHGWVADRMGDSTARWLGRLSLNPIKHLDPMGTIMLFVFGFGWAKPVPVNFNKLRDFRKGHYLCICGRDYSKYNTCFYCSLSSSTLLSMAFRVFEHVALLLGSNQHHARRL